MSSPYLGGVVLFYQTLGLVQWGKLFEDGQFVNMV